ncbi:amino acid transporter, partial [Elysia marginata]
YTGVGTDTGTAFTIGLLGILASLAIPAVNSSSVVAVVIILESMSVPTTGTVGLIMAMEWLNDRVRTTSNAMSHITCVLTTWRLSKKSFLPVPTAASDEPEDKVSRV